MRREYGLHPWEAQALPTALYRRYVLWLPVDSWTVRAVATPARAGGSRTVREAPPVTPATDAEHRQRLRSLRGFRG